MISSFSLRPQRLILVAVVVLNIGLFGLAVSFYDRLPDEYINKINSHAQAVQLGFKSLTNKFDFGYLDADIELKGDESLLLSGVHLGEGDTQFTFVNAAGKQGTPREILRQNTEIYRKHVLKEIHEPKDYDIELIRPPADPSTYNRANATIVALVRNNEAIKIKRLIRKLEQSFNAKFKYPYTFLNDEPFSDSFKRQVQKVSDAPMEFVVIPPGLWRKPDSIDEAREKAAMEVLSSHNIAYAKRGSYHNMCRFYSGNFYHVPELQKYRYYWRVEPDVDFYSNINYDVFKYLEGTNKVYGFTINLYDIDETVTSLWPDTLRYLNSDKNHLSVHPNGAFQWLVENQQNPKKNKVTGGYSTCHFWLNFEIGDMDFFRAPAYDNWFKFLDSTGNFYYERWGDAPVHSMGLALFADKKSIHWFQDIGYKHDPYFNCPNSPNTKGCEVAKFLRWEHLNDQNCMATWIDYSMEGRSPY